ncbi:MAG TPA: DinB family protein [Chitinophagaceae bacterium]
MKKMYSHELLDKLQSDTREIILAATYLLREDPAILVQQPAPGRWSVTQVIEHLNSYGRYYLPAMESAMKAKPSRVTELFKPGWLGDYFTKMMLPGKNGKVGNKMKSPKDHRPEPLIDSKPVLEEFLKQQQLLLDLLQQAKKKDLSGIRIPITISRFIRLKLGDTFRFLIAHQQRHFVQVKNTLAEVKAGDQPVFDAALT